MSLSELWELVMDREAWHAVIHGVARTWNNWATELNWTELLPVISDKQKGCWWLWAHLHRESMTVVCGNFHLSEVYRDIYHNTVIIMALLGLQAKVSARWAMLWPCAFIISYPKWGPKGRWSEPVHHLVPGWAVHSVLLQVWSQWVLIPKCLLFQAMLPRLSGTVPHLHTQASRQTMLLY